MANVDLTVSVEKTYVGLTVDELAEKLKILGDDDFRLSWKIEKNYDYDHTGYGMFKGLYNLIVSSNLSHIGGQMEPKEISKYADICYKNLAMAWVD